MEGGHGEQLIPCRYVIDEETKKCPINAYGAPNLWKTPYVSRIVFDSGFGDDTHNCTTVVYRSSCGRVDEKKDKGRNEREDSNRHGVEYFKSLQGTAIEMMKYHKIDVQRHHKSPKYIRERKPSRAVSNNAHRVLDLATYICSANAWNRQSDDVFPAFGPLTVIMVATVPTRL